MNELKVFTNDKFGTIRTVELEGTAYFVGKDLAEILGYSNINKAIQVHVDEEDKKILNFKGFSHFVTNLWEGNDFSNKTLINESGVYSLIFGSELPTAKEFKRWVTHEVLPAIRKTGGYNSQQSDEYKAKRLEVMMINAKARLMKEQNKRIEMLIKNPEYTTNEFTADITVIPKTYSANEVGAMLGVSGNKIGRLANANGLKTEEYGEWFKDKAKNADKEVQSFRYNDKGVAKLKEFI